MILSIHGQAPKLLVARHDCFNAMLKLQVPELEKAIFGSRRQVKDGRG